MLSDALDYYDVKLDRPAAFKLVSPRGNRAVACQTLFDAVQMTRERYRVSFVKVEVWAKHYRLRTEDGRCIGVVRFRGKDPIKWEYPPQPKAKRAKKQYPRDGRVTGIQHYTCTGCKTEFDASPAGRKPGHDVWCSTKCRKREYQRACLRDPVKRERINAVKRAWDQSKRATA